MLFENLAKWFHDLILNGSNAADTSELRTCATYV
jgi:hypothetical protein